MIPICLSGKSERNLLTNSSTMDDLPEAAITGNLEICEGEVTTLTAIGGSSYFWNTNETTADITVAPFSNSQYSVVITGSNKCTVEETVFVDVNSLPEPIITGDLDICDGESTILTAIGGSSYLWNTNDKGIQQHAHIF